MKKQLDQGSEEHCWVITQASGAVMLQPIKLQHVGFCISAGPLQTCIVDHMCN